MSEEVYQPEPGEEAISIREYARRRGCSDMAVHKARKAGKIGPAAFTVNGRNGRPMIYQSVADKMWKENFTPVVQNEKLAERFVDGIGEEEPVVPETKVKQAPGKKEEIDPKDKQMLVASKKAKEYYGAKKLQLQYEKEAGLLVEKEKVYKALYAFGNELRTALLSIPDGIVDLVQSAETRAEGIEVMTTAIIKELDRMSEIQGKDLTQTL